MEHCTCGNLEPLYNHEKYDVCMQESGISSSQEEAYGGIQLPLLIVMAMC